jgi:hypothetical protein
LTATFRKNSLLRIAGTCASFAVQSCEQTETTCGIFSWREECGSACGPLGARGIDCNPIKAKQENRRSYCERLAKVFVKGWQRSGNRSAGRVFWRKDCLSGLARDASAV